MHHHHRHHGGGGGALLGLGVGLAVGSRMSNRRMYRGRRGYGRSVVVIQAPPPPPAVLARTSISRYSASGDTTLYHIDVFAMTGAHWEVAARYSAFEALHKSFEYAPIREPFPGKKPIRSLFGLKDAALIERREELERWLSGAVAASQGLPWMRNHLHNFLRVPAGLRAPAAAAAAASNNIKVQMPPGVAPGEILEIEVHGQVYNIPAPEGVAAGATFEVELPEEDRVAVVGDAAAPPLAGAAAAYSPMPAQPQYAQASAAPMASAAPVAAPQMQSMQVVVPPGLGPGQTIMVQAPSGAQMQVVVPPGLAPGQAIIVQFPAAPASVPTAIAQPYNEPKVLGGFTTPSQQSSSNPF